MQEAARVIQRSEGQLTTIEQRLEELDSQQKLLQGSLAQRHGQIATLLSAMQRIGRNPPPVIITRREDALQMVRSAMLLGRAFPELRDQATDLSTRLSDLARVMDETKVQRDRRVGETSRLKDQQIRLASLMETKRQTQSERQEQLEEVRKAAADISKNVTDLSELIGRLDRAVAENTALGSYEKKVASLPRTAIARSDSRARASRCRPGSSCAGRRSSPERAGKEDGCSRTAQSRAIDRTGSAGRPDVG